MVISSRRSRHSPRIRRARPVLLSVVVGVLGAAGPVALAGVAVNLYAQIGWVVLVALAPKNGIRTVEFAVERGRHGSRRGLVALPDRDDDQLRVHLGLYLTRSPSHQVKIKQARALTTRGAASSGA
jgi:hypothetical protein